MTGLAQSTLGEAALISVIRICIEIVFALWIAEIIYNKRRRKRGE